MPALPNITLDKRVPMVELIVLHGVRTVQLTQGYNTLVDEADYSLFVGIKWCVLKQNPNKCRTIYAQGAIRLPGGGWKLVRAHRHLDSSAPLTDHKNRDGLDNRRAKSQALYEGG